MAKERRQVRAQISLPAVGHEVAADVSGFFAHLKFEMQTPRGVVAATSYVLSPEQCRRLASDLNAAADHLASKDAHPKRLAAE